METARGRAAVATAALVVAAVVLPFVHSLAAGAAAAAAEEEDQGARPCFEACFNQCVPRDEFWFCQFSCYHRCAGGSYYRATVPGHLGCDHPCAVSLCGRLRPGSKIMAACRDTCRKTYALAACSS